MEKETNSTRKGSGRWIGKVAIGIAAFWVVSIIALEILLSTPLLTNTVNRIASQYIDGNISFGKVSASVLIESVGRVCYAELFKTDRHCRESLED